MKLNYMAKHSAKKRHIANLDTDSEKIVPSFSTNLIKFVYLNKKPFVPKFLIIHSEKEVETTSSLSPFLYINNNNQRT